MPELQAKYGCYTPEDIAKEMKRVHDTGSPMFMINHAKENSTWYANAVEILLACLESNKGTI